MDKFESRIMGVERETHFNLAGNGRGLGGDDVVKVLPEGLDAVIQFLTNGSRHYVDINDKLEYAGPESAGCVEVAYTEVAGDRILLNSLRRLSSGKEPRIKKEAWGKCVTHGPQMSNARVEPTEHSWGYHENYSMTREDFESTIHHPFLYAHLAARNVMVGAGKVNMTDYGYTVTPSQKISAISSDISSTTTVNRGLINTRDEPHSHSDDNLARLHLLCGEPNLTSLMTILKFGSTSLALRLAETRIGDASKVLPLDPLKAAHIVGSDMSLKRTFPLDNGKLVTGLALEEELLEQSERMSTMVELPNDERYALTVWREVVDALRRGPEEAMGIVEYIGLSSFMKHYFEKRSDLIGEEKRKKIENIAAGWFHLDPELGIGYRWMDEGKFDLLDEKLVEHYMYNPPATTRAAARVRFMEEHIIPKKKRSKYEINWSYAKVDGVTIILSKPDSNHYAPYRTKL